MKHFLFVVLIAFVATSLPLQASALTCSAGGTPQTFSDLICMAVDLVNIAIPIVMALALLVFVWGLAKFILNAGSDEKREEGKEVMKWGIVALFVLVSVWGIIAFISNDILGFSPSQLPLLPE